MTPITRHGPGVVLTAFVVAAAVLVGCGDDDENASPTAEPDPPTTTAPRGGEPRRLDFGDTIQPNVTYSYPMDLHCGLDQLGEFNGTAWILTEAPGGNPEEGAGEARPEHWPIGPEGVEGQLVLVDDGRIEYSLPDGELIAVYEPSPDPFVPCM